jgi:hypothetical protein
MRITRTNSHASRITDDRVRGFCAMMIAFLHAMKRAQFAAR